MRKVVLLLWACCCWALASAVSTKAPKWMDKQRKAVVTVVTYNQDNQQIASGNGFFVSESGELLSGYSLFKNAARAVVKDADGREMPVTHILGADELYDVVRCQVEVSKKVTSFTLATAPLAKGAVVYLLPFSPVKTTKFGEGTVTEVSKLKDPYHYYELSMPLEPGQANAPLLTESGEVFGLAQEDASGKNEHSYAVSAAYAHSLLVKPADLFNTTYSSIKIRKAWPENPEEAQVALYLQGSIQDAKSYLETLNDFIATFPSSVDGYVSRASHYAYRRAELATSAEEQCQLLDKSLEDLQTAERFMEKKSDNLYEQAKLIYGVAVSDSTLDRSKWSVEVALDKLKQAMDQSDDPLYHQLRADIYYNAGRFQEAYDDYMVINQSAKANAVTWYWAFKAKQQISGAKIGDMIALLDNAVAACGNPPTAEAGPYILERIEWKLKLMNYESALADYDLYYTVMDGKVNDSFYYFREQIKFRMDDLEGALADIRQALQMNPNESNYYAEEASVLLRQEKPEEALQSLSKALLITPDFAACHRLRGVCLLRLKKSAEACEALQKAKELGDPVADRLLQKHCK